MKGAGRVSSGKLSILVLGASGIIGREICRAAAIQSHRVYALSRGRKPLSLGTESADHVTPIVLDGYDAEALSVAVDGMTFDVVVDLLSFKPEQLLNFLDVLADRCAQYVFVSSATVYGSAPSPGLIAEDSPLAHADWRYPEDKVTCENVLKSECEARRLSYTVVRPYITYSNQRIAFGAWETDTVLTRIARRDPVVIGTEIAAARTTLTHSSDLARGIVALMANSSATNEIFHVVSDEVVSWRQVYETAAGILGEELRERHASASELLRVFPNLRGKVLDRSMDRAFNIDKFRKACPDFEFEYDLASGYRQAISTHLRTSPLSYRSEGRMDRLVKSAAISAHQRISLHRRVNELGIRSGKDLVEYLSGYSAVLDQMRARAKSFGSVGATRDPYAVG